MTNTEAPTREWLVEQILALRPWHHDIELTDNLDTGKVFSPEGRLLPKDNDGVSLISPRDRFFTRVQSLYPHGLAGKRFLDCACNGGAYCFYAREMDADFSVGFDIRGHWIKQAKFVQKYRTVSPTDRIQFMTMDLYEVPQQNLDRFDLVYFSGLFYHLPDPVTGLKIAADLASDVIVLNTAMVPGDQPTAGLTLVKESTERVMSGVYELAWFPNNPDTLKQILGWLGFVEMKLTKDNINPAGRRRVEVIAARQKRRLEHLPGEYL